MPINFDSGKKVDLPVGGDFVPSGFIGEWTAAIVQTFMSQTEPDKMEEMLKDREIGLPISNRKAGNEWYRYYWKSREDAQAAADADDRYNPTSVWCMEAARDSIFFGNDETRSKFGPIVSYDHCQVTTPRSKKHRHEMHLISLPLAMWAVAKNHSWDAPEPDWLETLTSQDTAFTDDLFERLICHPDSNDWLSGTLGQYRTRLWEALGESDPTVYRMHIPGGGKYVCNNASKLSQALAIMECEWESAIWCRVIPVPDPMVDAVVASSGKRLQIPSIVDIYDTKEAAQAAFDADQERFNANSGDSASTPSSGPVVPPDWKEFPEDWKQQVRDLKTGPKPKIIGALREEGDEAVKARISATIADVEAWWDAV